MLVDKVKKVYGKKLPGKSQFRNDPEAPCSIEEISEEFGNWDNFVVEYNKKESKPAPAKATTKAGAAETNDSTK